MKTAEQALSDLIDAIDAVGVFPDLEGGCYGNGYVVQACHAIGKPIPPNLSSWLIENDSEASDTDEV